MNPREELVNFLSENPECHLISQSKIHMHVLDSILSEARSFNDLRAYFHSVEPQDLVEILDSLVLVELAGRVKTDNKHVYYATSKGKKFMEKYENAKKAMV
ncbi:MAG: hypothetical protein ABH854_04680 [Candidatus Diapherotrites archaeon]|nr:hypothetical protein [Candidatus Micrarchaeota archaeon]MBU1939698.1 hypothetical protein [Candidatus Micrarchaeota archaeon]